MNSTDVALLMGVNVSTIKRWTNSSKLPCYQTPGGHRKFTLGHINKFLKNYTKKIRKINLIQLKGLRDKELIHYIEHAEFTKLIPIFIKAAIESNRRKIRTIITGLYLKGEQLENIYDFLVFPVMRTIGDLWEEGKLSIPEEHLASEVLREAIYDLGESLAIELPYDAPSAICFSLVGDEHELPLIMTKQLLELNGIRTFNMGRSLPVKSLFDIFEKIEPLYIIISANYYDNKKTIINEMHALLKIIGERKIRIFIGGSVSNIIKNTFGEKIFEINNMCNLKQRFQN